MKYVEFYYLFPTGQTTIGRAVLSDGKITFQGFKDDKWLQLLQGIQIMDKIMTPKDGLKYLENLKIAFSGSLFRASDVMQGIPWEHNE